MTETNTPQKSPHLTTKSLGQSDVDAVIGASTAIRDSLSALVSGFTELRPAIEEEHTAIKSGDLAAVEAACKHKTAIGDEIELQHQVLRNAVSKISRLADLFGIGKEKLQTIHDAIDILDDISEGLIQTSGFRFAADVLKRLLSQIRSLTTDFNDRAKAAQPLIEMNRYLVQTLLHNYQESYRFWVDTAAEVEATYNDRGVQKSKGVGSTLNIRA